MEKKILAIMVSLVVIAAVVVGVVMVASGGLVRAGGFTSLFDKMENTGSATYNQVLAMPSGWSVGKDVKVSDTIMDMSYQKQTVSSTTVYLTTIWFQYMGEKWNDPTRGTSFYVPDTSHAGFMHVVHGSFTLTVSSATNISAKYHIGGTITLETALVSNGVDVAFGDWHVASII
jgi:hypothetical protein